MIRRTLVGVVVAGIVASLSPGSVAAQTASTITGQGRTFTVTRDVPFSTIVATFTDPNPGQIATTATYVDRVYRDLFGRPADSAGASWWAGRLDAGVPRTTFTNALVSTSEWANAVVRSAYQELLGRAAGGGETGPWAGAIVHGSQVLDVRAMLLGSDEFLNAHGGTVDGFIDGLWQVVLGRPADSGARSWMHSLLDAGANRAVAARAVLVTGEAWARRVDSWYRALLARSAASSDEGYWVQVLTHSTPEQALPVTIAASDEYVARLPNDYSATVTWGNGTPAPGRVAFADGHTLVVVAGNRLPVNGTAPVTVDLTRKGGSPVRATGQVTVEGARNERFVSGVAEDLLGYALDPGSISYWMPSLLSGGRAARTRVAQTFVGSPDGRLRAVTSVFSAYLGRNAGAGSWVSVAGQQGIVAVRVGVLSSDEFVRDSGGTDDAWADALYQKVLGRPAGDAGRAYVSSLLAAGQPRWVVARAILGSDEAHADLLNDVYQALLHRAPSSAEQATFVSWMRTSVSEESLQAIVAGSREYFDAYPMSDA